MDDVGLATYGLPTVPAFDWDDAPALFQACASHGVEGIVLKQLSARYLPGKRTTAWRKLKCRAWPKHRGRRPPGSHTPRTSTA